MMGQTLFVVAAFVAVLAMLPWAVKWLQRRLQVGGVAAAQGSRLVSVLAVGPQQRVVTVEVGPDHARTWLVLGVTGQSITCLHTTPAAVPAPSSPSYAAVAAALPTDVHPPPDLC